MGRIERLRDSRDWFGALALIEQARAARPGDDGLYRLRVLTLADIGASHRAWQLYRDRPTAFSDVERSRLEAGHLARLIGWSRLYASDEDKRLSEAESALQALAQLRVDANRDGLPLGANVAIDELILLNRLGRHGEVVERYHALLASGRDIPAYALPAAGDSLLAMRLPDEAAVVLERAHAAAPEDPDLVSPLAYAQLERERFDLALPLLARQVEAQAAWPRAPGARRGYQNWHRYDLESTWAMATAFGEDLEAAQARLEPLAAIAPANADLQGNLGSVYLYRGWTERALERYRIAATLDERNVAARIGQVDALGSLQRTDLARPLHDALRSGYPAEPRVQTMDRNWRRRLGPSVAVSASRGRSGDGAAASPFGNRDSPYRVDPESPLAHDRWRLAARSDHRQSEFQQQGIDAHYQQLGLRYGFGPWNAALMAGRASDGLGGTAVGLDASWRIDDAWQLRGAIARNDPQASLQARLAGITADSAMLAVDYYRNESSRWSLGLQQLRYDDGNRREGLMVSGEQRWLSRPHLLLGSVVDASASRASRSDAPYFNPSRDAALDMGMRIDHLGWRRYDRHFRHRATVTVGPHWQRDFGTHWVPSARYEHEWQFAPGRVLVYGIDWARPVYDGQRESRIGLDAGFRWGN